MAKKKKKASLECYPQYVTFYGFLSFALYPWLGVICVDVSHRLSKVGHLSLGTEGGAVFRRSYGAQGRSVAGSAGRRPATRHTAPSPPSCTPALPEPWLGPEPGPQTQGPRGPQALSAAPGLPACPAHQPGDPGLEPHERAGSRV